MDKVPTTKTREAWVVTFADGSVFHVFAKHQVEAADFGRILLGKPASEVRLTDTSRYQKKAKNKGKVVFTQRDPDPEGPRVA